MGELTLNFLEDSIDIGEDGKLIGRIPRQSVDSEGLALLKRENQLRMGTVHYQSWAAGVLSGVTLLFGPPHPVEVPVAVETDQKPVPTTFDGMLPGAELPTGNGLLEGAEIPTGNTPIVTEPVTLAATPAEPASPVPSETVTQAASEPVASP